MMWYRGENRAPGTGGRKRRWEQRWGRERRRGRHRDGGGNGSGNVDENGEESGGGTYEVIVKVGRKTLERC